MDVRKKNGSIQPFNIDKIKLTLNKEKYPDVEWVVDGGVNLDNIQEVYSAGADVVVSGRTVFGGGMVKENIHALKYKCLKE